MAITFVGSNTQDSAGALSSTLTISGGATAGIMALYDVQMTDNSGRVRTSVIGTYTFVQDITK